MKNHDIVYHFAANPDIEKADFTQEGEKALIRCIERYDPDAGTSIGEFVNSSKRINSETGKKLHRVGRIEGAMLDLIRSRRHSRRKGLKAKEIQHVDMSEDGRYGGYRGSIAEEPMPGVNVLGKDKEF